MTVEPSAQFSPQFRVVRLPRRGAAELESVDPRSTDVATAGPAELRVSVTELADNVVVVSVCGELVVGQCAVAQDVLDRVFHRRPCRIVVNAAPLTRMDRAGMAVLTAAAERAAEWDYPFAISGLAEQYHRLTLTAGFRAVQQPSLDAAARAVSQQYLTGEPTRVDLLRLIRELSDDRTLSG